MPQNLSPFRPTPSQYSQQIAIRGHVIKHKDEYSPAAKWLDRVYSTRAIRHRELKGRHKNWRSRYPPGAVFHRSSPSSATFRRLGAFVSDAVGTGGKPSWDLTCMSDSERLLRSHAICYVAWLLSDPEAGDRGVGLTAMEKTPFETDDRKPKRGKKDFQLERRFSRHLVLDLDESRREAWLALVEIAWTELQAGKPLCEPTTSDTGAPMLLVEGTVTDLVTLDQLAAIIRRSKRTLERDLRQKRLPEPDVRGGGGRPHKWLWANLRGPAGKLAQVQLPERFPGSRFIG